MCEHPATRLVIGAPGPDGSVHTRAWTICSHAAERLAEQLGPPSAETIATAEAARTYARALGATPGVIRTGDVE
jgi:hypothetical protein